MYFSFASPSPRPICGQIAAALYLPFIVALLPFAVKPRRRPQHSQKHALIGGRTIRSAGNGAINPLAASVVSKPGPHGPSLACGHQ
ncbi:hypothetical protein SAMD00023353_7400100 [Rosellinia necatrix]|uniref:Uncharacterized protein n=1 Tax=Rosellinia necatrix TaxID=77044 RepID=A0A1S8AAK2_ROSNE|nr:hypothetical protein SAMD00023353_7400100 [Rosellinia necatrix]